MSKTKKKIPKFKREYIKGHKKVKRKRLRNHPIEEPIVEKKYNDAEINL